MKLLPIQTLQAVSIGLLMGAATHGCADTSNDKDNTNYYDYCDPEVAAAECYSTRRAPESAEVALATDIALRYIETHPYEVEEWDWKPGVLMHALAELYRVTGDTRLHDYYESWLDYRIAQGYQIVWSDSCPPAITAVALLKEAPNEAYQQVLDDTFEYLDVTAPRTEEGGISHNGILGNRASVWLDSLFMFGMVLNRASELEGNEARLEMMAEQSRIITGVLQDENGFMRHAQDWPGYDESIYWARGNSWVVAALADYLRIRVEREESDPELEGIFGKHVEAILGVQDESGMWQTVMSHPDEPDNVLETSASALFAYGIARAWRYGLLDDEARKQAQKAVAGIAANRVVDDVVTGVSTATDPWPLRSPTGGEDGYLDVPVEDDVNYGVGAVILALIETSGLPE